ncbi:toll/interleukin-1 receptor domain-containing protein [Bradyrhizobium sp. AT1]|uniref:toll/interleukin-1 receptor domain-containing protein n=1 Tax=Bradyrhizobium sp. AT1 TaxID=574934 RepID=UPI000A076C83|nr:toll/interleukin-1 receptor domain-containing protein [Bradyrhizobium sp. AT1]
MRVFISWSGDQSRALAETFRNWIPSALQYVKPYFTPADIEKGSKWATEIFKELSASSICILVLTRDNLASNWIMFEAGAISSALDRAKVCPVIFDLEETDLQGPLAQFQATKFNKEDIRKLFFTINAAAGDQKLSDAVLTTVFEKWWPDLEAQLHLVLTHHKAARPEKNVRSDRDIIEELLLLTRKLSEARTKAPDAELVPSAAPSMKYETSLYKSLFTLAREFFDLGGYEHDHLIDMKASVDRLLAHIPKRMVSISVRSGLGEELSALSADIEELIRAEVEAS